MDRALPFVSALPMFVGTTERVSKPLSMFIGRMIIVLFLVVGTWQGYATTQTFPYIATYDFLGIWILSGLFCAFGFIATFSKLTRWPAKVFWALVFS